MRSADKILIVFTRGDRVQRSGTAERALSELVLADLRATVDVDVLL